MQQTQLEVLNARINGMYYYDIEHVAHQLALGQRVLLKPDPNAIEVYRQNNKLGYIPKVSNRLLFNRLMQKQQISAYISELNINQLPYAGLEIKVHWEV